MNRYEAFGNPADADFLLGHSFGTSTDESSPNYQLAELMLEYSNGRPMVADRTLVNAMPNGDELMAHIVEGPVTNISAQGVGTWGTWVEAKEYMEENGLRRPLVLAQAKHIDRAVRQGAKLGITSIVPEDLPTAFDKDSDQIWTRSPYLWIPFNAIGSILLKKRGQL